MTLLPVSVLVNLPLETVSTGDHHAPTKALKKLERCRLSRRPFRMLHSHSQVIFDAGRGSQPLIANRAAVLKIFPHLVILQKLGPLAITKTLPNIGPLHEGKISW